MITLTVTAETPRELKGYLLGLADLVDTQPAIEEPVVTAERETTASTTTSVVGAVLSMTADAPPKRGRGRPRKPDQIVPERATEPYPTEVQLDPPTPAETATAAPVAQANPLPPTAPPVSDAPEAKITIDEVRAALKALVDAKGRDAAMAVIRAQGFEKLSDVAEQMYGEIIAKAKAACA